MVHYAQQNDHQQIEMSRLKPLLINDFSFHFGYFLSTDSLVYLKLAFFYEEFATKDWVDAAKHAQQ